jgi:hypothetical protein
MLPVLLLPLLGLALHFGLASLRNRLEKSAPLRPSLTIRRWLVVAVTLVGVAAHLASWLPLRHAVPAGAGPGGVLYGGPGDGLFIMVSVIAPWFLMQPINVLLACYCSRTKASAALVMTLLVAIWIAAAALGNELTKCPEGFRCVVG